jgi:aspartyl-tRNA(Asn)/glutamyl-tRNA(Gln) amidotransferase subunit A
VIKRLAAAGAVFLGRTNMDEFAMGSSCEYSCYGAVRNPRDRERTAGGSSGGSAAVVAAKQAPLALGSDTGGSVRLPASFCGVYGLKPSYGTLSRYGLVAFGSSLDQIGFLARSAEDLHLVLSVTAGADSRDQTCEETGFSNMAPLENGSLSGLKVGIPGELVSDAVDPQVLEVFDRFRKWLESAGAKPRIVSIPALEACVAMYYIIAPAEASSNLSRFDGVKYGRRASGAGNLEEMYEKTREEGFGPEVKRRILIGNYVLSSGYYDAYYKKAQGVRALLQENMNRMFEEVDLIASPTSPALPFRLGEKVDDPLSMYLVDICTTPANLTRSPSLSLPGGNTPDGLPVGVQITGRRFAEPLLLSTAFAWEREMGG